MKAVQAHAILVMMILLVAGSYLALEIASPKAIRGCWGAWAVVLIVLVLANLKGGHARRR